MERGESSSALPKQWGLNLEEVEREGNKRIGIVLEGKLWQLLGFVTVFWNGGIGGREL